MSAATIAILTDPVCQEHDTGLHPESKQRLAAIESALSESGMNERVLHPSCRPATMEQVLAIHERFYVEQVRRTAALGGGSIDWDTSVSAGSYRAAMAAAGCALAAVDVVLSGEAQASFALVRPPGHHARPGRGMGFCLFNNVAIAAQHARLAHKLQRVLIVDFDAHHGNGTQESFYSSNGVLYFSSHLSPFFPGTGAYDETGAGPGLGYTVNVPLPEDCADDGFLQVYSEVLIPLARRFHPQLVLVSAGYDIHWADPLTALGASTAGIGRLVRLIGELAAEECDGRLAFVLEGGYHLAALASGVLATVAALLGDADVVDPLGPFAGRPASVSEIVAMVKHEHGL